MRQDRFHAFLEAQKKEMEVYKWNLGIKICKDPGSEAIQEWILKYAKKFRRGFAIEDLKQALQELQIIRNNINDYFQKITFIVNEVNHLNKIVNECENKIMDGVELLETEPDQN